MENHEIAAALARLATQMEHVREGQDRTAADVARLTVNLEELARTQRSQKTFVMGISATVTVLWGAALALYKIVLVKA